MIEFFRIRYDLSLKCDNNGVPVGFICPLDGKPNLVNQEVMYVALFDGRRFTLGEPREYERLQLVFCGCILLNA